MNFLVELIPARYRRFIYGLLALVSLVYGTWEAAEGDWRVTAVALLTAATTALAHANTAEVMEPGKGVPAVDEYGEVRD